VLDLRTRVGTYDCTKSARYLGDRPYRALYNRINSLIGCG